MVSEPVLRPPCILVFSEDSALFSDIVSALPSTATAKCISDPRELDAAIRDSETSLLVFVLPSDAYSYKQQAYLPSLRPPELPTIIIARDGDVPVPYLNALLALHPRTFVGYPSERERLPEIVDQVLSEASPSQRAEELETTLAETNRRLNERLQELNTIYTVGKSVVSSLDVDQVLERAVTISVNLTQADDGFILLKESGRLVVRIAKYKDGDHLVQEHRETSDLVAQQVIRSGRPTMLHRETKIATGLLARALLYVPLQAPGAGTIGVLGVVNRLKDQPFTEHQLFTLSSVADFAAIALENARLFAAHEAERLRLSAILEQAAEAIIVTDINNRLWLWSETAAHIFDIPAEAQGQLLTQHIRNAQVRDLFAQSGDGNTTRRAEITLEDGRVFNAQLSTIDAVGRVAVMQEITHLKELDRLRSEFVSTVSHDLRTPLTTIQGYIELLDRAGPLNDLQRDFVGRALRSLSHITDLISDLLDIGRIEAGYDFEMAPVRLDEIVQDTAEAAQVYAAQEKIQLSTEVVGGALWVWGNRRRLQQVMENLISNAIKYNRPGGWVRVHVRPDHGHIITSVSDSGIGIPPEEQGRIFERLYRVQSPETEGIQGTGLGLAIVKSVIEKHKGRVWVESAPGKGSTFTFVLPIYHPSE